MFTWQRMAIEVANLEAVLLSIRCLLEGVGYLSLAEIFHLNSILTDLEESFFLDEAGVMDEEQLAFLQLRLICGNILTLEDVAYARVLTDQIIQGDTLTVKDIVKLNRVVLLLKISFERRTYLAVEPIGA